MPLPSVPLSLPGIVIGLQLCHSHLSLCLYLVLSLVCSGVAPMSPQKVTWYYHWFTPVSFPSTPLYFLIRSLFCSCGTPIHLCHYLVLSLICRCVAPSSPYVVTWYYHWFADVWLPSPPLSLPGIIIGLGLCHSHLPLCHYLVLLLVFRCVAPICPCVFT